MRNCFVLLLALLLAMPGGEACGASAVIFSGSTVKALKDTIDINGKARVLTGTATPTTSATDAPIGSIYLNSSTGLVYRKTDAGSSTNWVQLFAPDGPREITNLSLSGAVAGSALTISLKTKSGGTPSATDVVRVGFRSATLATGTYSQVATSAALTTVISSGSTGGFVAAQNEVLHIFGILNSSTMELAWSTSRSWDEGTLQTTTAEGGAGAADSRTVLYSTTARASVPIRYLGSMQFSLATPGTWDEVPDVISTTPSLFSTDESSVIVDTGSGHGAVNTKIRIFTSANAVTVGTALTYATSANNGDSITVNKPGMYVAEYSDSKSGGASEIGISLNSTQLTTDPSGITKTDRVAFAVPAATQYLTAIMKARRLKPGDVLRAHDGGSTNSTASISYFSVQRIGD